MKVVAKTDEYTIYQKRNERYGVRDADRNWVNGDAKVAILLEHKLIEENRRFLTDFVEIERPSPYKHFLERGRVALSDGSAFGEPGHGFARINFATSRAILTEALERRLDITVVAFVQYENSSVGFRKVSSLFELGCKAGGRVSQHCTRGGAIGLGDSAGWHRRRQCQSKGVQVGGGGPAVEPGGQGGEIGLLTAGKLDGVGDEATNGCP